MYNLSGMEVFHCVEELHGDLLPFCRRGVFAQELRQSTPFNILHHDAASRHFVVFDAMRVDDVWMVEGYG